MELRVENEAKWYCVANCNKVFYKTIVNFRRAKNKQSEPEILHCFEMNYEFLERHKSEKILWTRLGKWQAKQDEEATTEEVPGSIVIYTEEEINTFNRDIKLPLLSLGHFISFSFAIKEVKGINYFPSRAKDLEIWKKILKIDGL